MPLFRKLPEIRKFQIERKNFRTNETVSLDKNKLIKKGEKGLEKKKMYQNSLIKNQNGNLFHNQRVNAATVKFRKFGIVPVSSKVFIFLDKPLRV